MQKGIEMKVLAVTSTLLALALQAQALPRYSALPIPGLEDASSKDSVARAVDVQGPVAAGDLLEREKHCLWIFCFCFTDCD